MNAARRHASLQVHKPVFRSSAATAGPSLARLKELKRQIIERHVQPDNGRGLVSVLSTLLPIAALLALVRPSAQQSYALSAGLALVTALFLVRAFVLMHECGHGSLFRSAALNRGFGFVLGVLTGMPQNVWSQHHQYHHANNGNWDRYRGPLNIVTVVEYLAMSPQRQSRYRRERSVWLAPLGGFVYLILSPRLNWIKGSVHWLAHMAKGLFSRPGVSLGAHASEFKTPCWATPQQYWHMFWNNVALLALWAGLAWLIGPTLFFAFFITALSLAGGAGIALFTVQHNFENSYASGDAGWDYHRAALEGTSLLVLPAWLNWFTANIAYHHVHHLSARIPSYCLAACHEENASLFAQVARIRLAQVPHALQCILWDTAGQRIVSVAQAQAQASLRPA